ncbi:hypothetical protein ACS0TY_016803 [Phlomoides rotata]
MSGHDSKYFSTTKKGEIPELKEELNSQYKDKRKDAVKKVFVAMTVGKDVSSLFTDAVNCMQTENLELKKPVYLYLINYAKNLECEPFYVFMCLNIRCWELMTVVRITLKRKFWSSSKSSISLRSYAHGHGEDGDDRLMGNDASKIILVQLLVVFQCGALGFRKFRVKESQFLEIAIEIKKISEAVQALIAPAMLPRSFRRLQFSVIGLEPFKSVKVQYGDDVRLTMPYVLPLPLLFFWISNMQQDHANKESRCTLKN